MSAITNSLDTLTSWKAGSLEARRSTRACFAIFAGKITFDAIRDGQSCRSPTRNRPSCRDSPPMTRSFRATAQERQFDRASIQSQALPVVLAASPLRVLDIGCAGGGFVRSLIDDGHFAVGLEGSDLSAPEPDGRVVHNSPSICLHVILRSRFSLTDRATNRALAVRRDHGVGSDGAHSRGRPGRHVREPRPPPGPGGLSLVFDRHLPRLGPSDRHGLARDGQAAVMVGRSVRRARASRSRNRHPFGKDDWLRGSGECRGDWHPRTTDGLSRRRSGMGFNVVLRRNRVVRRPSDQLAGVGGLMAQSTW